MIVSQVENQTVSYFSYVLAVEECLHRILNYNG
jgi:hypothetical protein